MKDLKCDVCGSTDVSISVEGNGKILTYDFINDELVENYREGNASGTDEEELKSVVNNIDNFDISGGCGNCEGCCDLVYGELDDMKEIFLEISKFN